MFHISDCKKFSRCPRLYFNDLKDDTTEYHPFVRLDEKVSDLAIQKLGIQEHFLGSVGDEAQKALDGICIFYLLVFIHIQMISHFIQILYGYWKIMAFKSMIFT